MFAVTSCHAAGVASILAGVVTMVAEVTSMAAGATSLIAGDESLQGELASKVEFMERNEAIEMLRLRSA